LIFHPRVRFREGREACSRAVLLARLHKLQHAEPKAIETYTKRKLARILDHCRRRIPFYRDWFTKNPVESYDLSHFPIINKDTLRTSPTSHLLPGIDEEKCWTNLSSGSTGEPMRFLFDRYTGAVVDKAASYFNMFESGYTLRDRLGKQAVRDIGKWWMKLGIMRMKAIPMVGDHFQTIRELVDWRATCLYFSPSLGEALAMANNQSKEHLRVKWIFTSNETLFQSAAALLSSSFEAKVFDRYGSAEFPGVAWTCEENNYHIIPEQIVETLDSRGEQVGPGERGILVLTTLNNTVEPLVRYDTQDLAIVGDTDRCGCGRTSPYLRRVEGRIHDFLVDHDGWGISPMILNPLMDDYNNIRRFKVRQTKRGEAVVEIVPARPDIDLETIPALKVVAERLKGRISLKVRAVESVEDTGGKRRIVDSAVKPDWLRSSES